MTAPVASSGTVMPPQPSPTSGATAVPTLSCLGGLSPTTCDRAAQAALSAVASSGWAPTDVWLDSGMLCPTAACLFDPSQSFPAPEPPSGGGWVGNAEVAFTSTDQHAGLNIAQVGDTLVPVLIGYRVPLLTWCTGGCSSSVSTDGNYKLELVLPRLTWNVGDPISGTAILSLTDSQPTKVAGASELIVAVQVPTARFKQPFGSTSRTDNGSAGTMRTS